MEKYTCTWCGFNGRWSKDLSFFCLCCVFNLLINVENRIVGGRVGKFTP